MSFPASSARALLASAPVATPLARCTCSSRSRSSSTAVSAAQLPSHPLASNSPHASKRHASNSARNYAHTRDKNRTATAYNPRDAPPRSSPSNPFPPATFSRTHRPQQRPQQERNHEREEKKVEQPAFGRVRASTVERESIQAVQANAAPLPITSQTVATPGEIKEKEKGAEEKRRIFDQAIEAPKGTRVIAAAGGKPSTKVYTLEEALAMRGPTQALEWLGQTKEGVVMSRIIERPLPPNVKLPKPEEATSVAPSTRKPTPAKTSKPPQPRDRPSLHLRLTFKMDTGDLLYRFDRAVSILSQGGVVHVDIAAHNVGDLRQAKMERSGRRLEYAHGLARQLLQMSGEGAARMSRAPMEETSLRCSFIVEGLNSPARSATPASPEVDRAAKKAKDVKPAQTMREKKPVDFKCELCGGPHAWTDCKA